MATDEVDSFLRGVASAPPLRPPPRIGETIGGRYVIEEFLGEGGMGSVYSALDEKLGEHVALKLVKPGFDEAALRDEVRLAQRVTHINVCRTFDLEEIDGRAIVKMEYIAGQTLAKRLERDGKMPIDEAVRIARAIAAGLGTAHAQGIVHGDLKPSNVMLVDQRVVLMDFGVAHLATAPRDGVHGTLGYLAPEKLRERSGDARSDHYALGCVLYEMLAGEPVQRRASPSASPPELGDAVPDVRSKRPEVARWLAHAVARLLAREPATRIAGVAQLVSGPRSPVRIAVPVALFALVAVAVGWRLGRAPAWSPRLWNAEAYLADIDDTAVSPDGAWIAVATNRYSRQAGVNQLAIVSLKSGQTFQMDASPELETPNSPRWLDDHTLIFIAVSKAGRRVYRQEVALDPPHFVGSATLVTPPEVTNVMAVDVCGDALVYVRWTVGAPMELWSSARDRPLLTGLGTQTLSSPRCDRAGRQVAIVAGTSFFGAGDLYVIDRASDTKHQLTSDSTVEGDAVFSADGRSIIAGRHVGESTQLYEIPATGGEWRRLTFDEEPDISPDVSRDGRVVAFTRDTSVFLVTISGKGYITNENASHIRPRVVDNDHVVTQRNGRGPSEITLIQISTSEVTPLAAGTDPFPSFDRGTIYFLPQHDRRFLAAVPTKGGATTYVATLPGDIIGGCGGFDGAHVLVQIGEQQASYRVSGDGAITDDHTGGLVCVSSSGWRAITTLGNATHKHPQLTIEAPDGRKQTLDVHSLFNRWLDDHRVTYCLKDCRVLDVLTHETTVLTPSTAVDGVLAVVTDDLRIVDWAQEARASLHAITNFDQR